ncbi:unnamed protein product, partial [Musa banksii]
KRQKTLSLNLNLTERVAQIHETLYSNIILSNIKNQAPHKTYIKKFRNWRHQSFIIHHDIREISLTHKECSITHPLWHLSAHRSRSSHLYRKPATGKSFPSKN